MYAVLKESNIYFKNNTFVLGVLSQIASHANSA